MRHTFESGEWVDLLPVQDLKLKHQQKLNRLLNSEVPLNDAGDVDEEFIKTTWPGGMFAYDMAWRERRLAIVAAIVITGWSYGVPRPEITEAGELVNADSLGEADIDLAAVIEPHLLKLVRKPDPKAVTTTSSNGRSKASAASLKA